MLEASRLAIAAGNRYGPENFRALGQVGQGWANVVLGRDQGGLGEVEDAVEHYRRIRAVSRLPVFLLVLSELCLVSGDVEKALAVVDEALVLVEAGVGETIWADATRLKAEILLTQSSTPDATAAEALFKSAIEIFRRQEAKLVELRAARGLARLWHEQGRTAAARELLSPIYDWFTEGLDAADLRSSKLLLDELL